MPDTYPTHLIRIDPTIREKSPSVMSKRQIVLTAAKLSIAAAVAMATLGLSGCAEERSATTTTLEPVSAEASITPGSSPDASGQADPQNTASAAPSGSYISAQANGTRIIDRTGFDSMVKASDFIAKVKTDGQGVAHKLHAMKGSGEIPQGLSLTPHREYLVFAKQDGPNWVLADKESNAVILLQGDMHEIFDALPIQ